MSADKDEASTSSSSDAGTASTSNPVKLFSSIDDTSKKYTLVFLVSLGTTLLVTGASGGRLLKRARGVSSSKAASSSSDAAATKPSPPSFTPAPSASASPNSSASLVPPSNSFSQSPAAAAAIRRPKPISPPAITPLSSNPHRIPRRQPLLKSWRITSSLDSATYFLPNATLLSSSQKLAEEIDRVDKLHEHGEGAEDPGAAPVEDDGFNPAWFAFKALAYATGITVFAFSGALVGVMAYLGVKDFEELSLALSHRVPPAIDSHRPTVPAWAAPPTPSAEDEEGTKGGDEEEHPDHKEGVAWWTMVGQTLNKEAEAQKREKREKWEQLEKDMGKNVKTASGQQQ